MIAFSSPRFTTHPKFKITNLQAWGQSSTTRRLVPLEFASNGELLLKKCHQMPVNSGNKRSTNQITIPKPFMSWHFSHWAQRPVQALPGANVCKGCFCENLTLRNLSNLELVMVNSSNHGHNHTLLSLIGKLDRLFLRKPVDVAWYQLLRSNSQNWCQSQIAQRCWQRRTFSSAINPSAYGRRVVLPAKKPAFMSTFCSRPVHLKIGWNSQSS